MAGIFPASNNLKLTPSEWHFQFHGDRLRRAVDARPRAKLFFCLAGGKGGGCGRMERWRTRVRGITRNV